MFEPVVRGITERTKARESRKQERFRVSSIGACLADQLFSLAGYPAEREIKHRSRRIFDIGDDIEYRGNKWLKEAGYKIFGRGHKLAGENPERSGAIDGFIVLDDIAYPYDWKSASSWSFKKWLSFAGIDAFKIKDRGWTFYDPTQVPNREYCPVKQYSKSYYYQGQGYLQLLQDSDERDVELEGHRLGDGFFFFVVNKDDACLYQEYMLYNPADIRQRLLTLSDGYGIIEGRRKSKKLVKEIRKVREYGVKDINNFPCKGCNHLKLCWGEEAPAKVDKIIKETQKND